MGFRNGAYAKVWDIRPKTPNVTSLRVSISKRPHGSSEYVQDFSGWISCVGNPAAQAASALQVGDRIKLGDVDVQTTYIKETNTTYTNFTVYNFEKATTFNPMQTAQSAPSDDPYDPTTVVPDGLEDEGLPF